MKFKLSSYDKRNSVSSQSSYGNDKKVNQMSNSKRNNKEYNTYTNANADAGISSTNEMFIDQRIRFLCTPKSRFQKEDNLSDNVNVNANIDHKSSLQMNPSRKKIANTPETKIHQRRESLIDKALISDEFFVESMNEFNSFRKTIDQLPNFNYNQSRQSHNSALNNSNYYSNSFKTPQLQNHQLNIVRRKSSAPAINIPSMKQINNTQFDNTTMPYRHRFGSEPLSEFTLNHYQEINVNDRKLRRFNSVYDSLSDDEDDKNTKTQFEYNESKYVFDLNHSYFLYGWNYVVFVIVVYTTFHSLTELAFNSSNYTFNWFELLLDFIYLADIVITFFTPFVKEEIVIKNRTEISLNYLQTFFAFDVIVGLPFELLALFNRDYKQLGGVSSSSSYPPVIYFKWLRIFRIVKIYSKEKDIQFSSRYLHVNISEFKFIVILFIVFIVLIHFASCIWIYLALSNKDPQNWLSIHSPQSESATDIYIASMYFVVVTVLGVGYGDIYGENDNEVLFSMALMLIGQLMFSFVLGSLSRLFEILDSENIQIEAKMEQLNQIALKYNINKTLKSNISKSIKQKIHKVNYDYYSFIDSLHSKLKSELILQMHRNLIKELNFFNEKKYDFVVYVLPLMQRTSYSKNEFIFSIGDNISEMYLVTQGCLSLKLGSAYDNIEIGQIRKKSHFGEIQLHFQSQSVYDFKAKTQTEVLVINQKDFMQIKDNFPNEINMLLKDSIRIMEVFETRRGLILILVAYGFSPSMFIPLLRRIDSLILNEDFDEYYFNDREMRDVYAYVSKLEEKDLVTLINETFTNVKVKPSLNVWPNPKDNLINIRTKALIQKLLMFNQGKINENGQYEFELDQSNSLSEDEETYKEMSCSMNGSMKNYVNSKTFQPKQMLLTPSEDQKGFSEMKLNQLRKELSLNKNKGSHNMIKEINDEIYSLQQLTKQDNIDNRNRLPLVEGDISLVRKEAKKKGKFSKESKEKIIRQLKANIDLLNEICSVYRIIAVKNQYEFE